MKIYLRMVPRISEEIVRMLAHDKDIIVANDNIDEASMDVSAVLRSYVEEEKKLNDEAKEQMDRRGMGQKDFPRIRDALAKQRDFKIGDEGIDFVIDQVIEMFMYSANVDEVFAEDHTIRKKVFDILKRFLDVDETIDRQARDRLKNLQEGTRDWDIAYEKEIAKLKQTKGLV